MDGDHDRFVACFHDSVCVYNEPEVSPRPVIQSRSELREWLDRLGERLAKVSISLMGVAEHGSGVVADAVIVGRGDIPEAWRLAMAIRFEDDLISEVRAFRDRDAAIAALQDA